MGVTAGDGSGTSSMTFLVGGSAEYPPLASAWRWARRLTQGVAPGAVALATTSVYSLWPLLQRRNREVRKSTLDQATLDARFARLSGHTLVWLFGGGFLTPASDGDVLPLVAKGLRAISAEAALTSTILGSLQQGDGCYTPGDSSPESAAWARAATVLRYGYFEQIHLIPAGSTVPPGFDTLAAKLGAIADCAVWWNRTGLAFGGDGAPVVPNGRGKPFVSQDGADVELKADQDKYLPGLERYQARPSQ